MKFRSNKGQLPFVELNGSEIADSSVIIKQLGDHFGRNSDTDAHLTSEQRNVAHATITMLENHFHWYVFIHRSSTRCNNKSLMF